MSDKELSGRELDVAIAKRVMETPLRGDGTPWPGNVLPYSSSIEAAMQVVEKFKEENVVLALLPSERRWRVSITPVDFEPERSCGCKNSRAIYYSQSLPYAICRAALAAIEES